MNSADTLRNLLALVTPERLARLDPALAAFAARTLDQMHDNVRAFLTFSPPIDVGTIRGTAR
jgi:hypothetical protein